ncbi:hypothetical protein TNCV_4304011 [Trichonephila clavipes]|nr:hypothetical protein TNCV_4304011 [Trichonephila clavipes]
MEGTGQTGPYDSLEGSGIEMYYTSKTPFQERLSPRWAKPVLPSELYRILIVSDITVSDPPYGVFVYVFPRREKK